MIVPKTLYQVTVTFGNKKIFFDPKDGKSAMSRTIDGVLEILKGRKDIKYKEGVITDYLNQARALVRRMEYDGFIYTGDRHQEEFNERKTGRGHCDRRCPFCKREVDTLPGCRPLFRKRTLFRGYRKLDEQYRGISRHCRGGQIHHRTPGSPRVIYSDSITAITWYRNKQTASSRKCPALQKAEIFLKVMEARIKDIEVLHWDNRLWGEIPADFGNK